MGGVMDPGPRPPEITEDTPIGPDVDLDAEDIRLADGTRLTGEAADAIRRAVQGEIVWITEKGERIAAIIGADRIPTAEKLASMWRSYGSDEYLARMSAAIKRAETGDD